MLIWDKFNKLLSRNDGTWQQMLREDRETGNAGGREREGSSGSTGVAKRKWLGETETNKHHHHRQQPTGLTS